MLGDTFFGVAVIGSQEYCVLAPFFWFFLEVFMRPSSRHGVSKGRSARQFRKHSGRTKSRNVAPPPMRGGLRI